MIVVAKNIGGEASTVELLVASPFGVVSRVLDNKKILSVKGWVVTTVGRSSRVSTTYGSIGAGDLGALVRWGLVFGTGGAIVTDGLGAFVLLNIGTAGAFVHGTSGAIV